jgi:hypothetical protein
MPKPHELLEAIPVPVKVVADVAAAGITVTAFINALPSIAAVLSIVWLLWQMYDRWKYGPKALRSKQDGD